MNKAVIYVRVSSKDQENEDFSIPAQLKALRNYANKQNLTIIKKFTEAETAKKSGRTQFNAMLKLITNDDSIQHILVEKTDRMTRNLDDLAMMYNLAKFQNKNIHFVKEGKIFNRVLSKL